MRNEQWSVPRRAMGAGAVAAAALLGGCVVAPIDGGYGYNYTTYGSPPPARYEVVPAAPNAAYVWVPGLWLWGGARYDWRPGYWGPRGHGGGPGRPGPGPRGPSRGHR